VIRWDKRGAWGVWCTPTAYRGGIPDAKPEWAAETFDDQAESHAARCNRAYLMHTHEARLRPAEGTTP